MRKLTYYIACSLDGFIAREDGALDDFEMGGEHFAELLGRFPETIPGHLRDQLGVDAPNARFDDVLMGRRTYEVALNIGVTNPYPHLDQYLISQTLATSPDANVQLVSSDLPQFVRDLKKQPGKGIWLCGGGSLASELLTEIDEVILKVNPFLLGSGIPLIAGKAAKTNLEMQERMVFDNGFMLLHYAVKH